MNGGSEGRRLSFRRGKRMPFYEYACRACGHAFEHLARRMDESAPACPSCGAPNPEKQLSVFSARVKADTPCGHSCADTACQTPTCGAGGGCPMSA